MYQFSDLHWKCLKFMFDGANTLTEGTKMQSAQSILC